MLDQYPRCGDCRRLYSGRTPPEDPPCGECRVEPQGMNADALRIFLAVRYQFIMGFNGPIDLNHLAVEAAMRREDLTDNEIFDRVCRLGQWWIARINDAGRNKD